MNPIEFNNYFDRLPIVTGSLFVFMKKGVKICFTIHVVGGSGCADGLENKIIKIQVCIKIKKFNIVGNN